LLKIYVAMSNWWKKNIWIIPLILAVFKIQSSDAIAAKTNVLFDSFTTPSVENRGWKSWLLAKGSNTCQQFHSQYQQVYGFETQSFYIGICQQENYYVYYRQSKLNPEKSLLLPAQIVFGGSIYQAVDGKTIYFVGIDNNGYYSSVMKNNNEIIFEPEINRRTATLAETSTSRGGRETISDESNTHEVKNDTFPSSAGTNSDRTSQICTRERTDLDSEFNGWQEFIGKSPKIVGEYATNNGHNFTHNTDAPKQASVETRDGLVVNLDVAPIGQRVNRVCIEPMVSTDSR
jgi:hypothetical protein